jgi:hypothetical protein
MNLRRHFVLVFAAVGLVVAFVQRLVFQLLVPYVKTGNVIRPIDSVTPARLYAAQLVAPALFLLGIAAGLWLALGTPAPQWTRKRWPWAIGAYYLLHLPHGAPLGFPLWLPPLFVRWSFLIYVALSFFGLACAVWILSDRLHPALSLIVVVPVLSQHFLQQIPASLRSGFSWLPTVLVLALAGWWLGDAAERFNSSTSSAS